MFDVTAHVSVDSAQFDGTVTPFVKNLHLDAMSVDGTTTRTFFVKALQTGDRLIAFKACAAN